MTKDTQNDPQVTFRPLEPFYLTTRGGEYHVHTYTAAAAPTMKLEGCITQRSKGLRMGWHVHTKNVGVGVLNRVANPQSDKTTNASTDPVPAILIKPNKDLH